MASHDLDEMREFWAAETDEVLFQALTIGRDKYTESALRVVADEAARRGLTKPERMKQLAGEQKAQQVLSPAEPGELGPGLIKLFLPELLKGLTLLLALLVLILLRIGIRRLF